MSLMYVSEPHKHFPSHSQGHAKKWPTVAASVRVCVSVCVCVCVCPSQAIPQKLLKLVSSNWAQWLPQILIMKISESKGRQRTLLLSEVCSAACSSLPSPKPVGFLQGAVRLCDWLWKHLHGLTFLFFFTFFQSLFSVLVCVLFF